VKEVEMALSLSLRVKRIVKRVGVELAPPIIKNLLLGASFSHGISAKQFARLWRNLDSSIKRALPQNLVEMLDHYVSGVEIQKQSRIWLHLSWEHILQLAEHGYQNFQQTIAKKAYWGEKYLNAGQLESLMENTDRVNLDISVTEIFKNYRFCKPIDSIQFHITDIVMLQYVLDQNCMDLVLSLTQPCQSLSGNPIFIRYKDRVITQELLNTVLELAFLREHLDDLGQFRTVLEIGAGSGRTAQGLIKIISNVKYAIVDIPPALFISQETLIEQFPGRKAKRFSSKTSSRDLSCWTENYDLIFLTPDQAQLLPPQSIDLAVAIDCLHEMTPDSINSYFDIFDRTSRYFYFKCWNQQIAITSKKRYGRFDYPVKSNWQRLFHDDCKVPNHYFHALYKISSERQGKVERAEAGR
jgi:putative sugar O-methyltransferase